MREGHIFGGSAGLKANVETNAETVLVKGRDKPVKKTCFLHCRQEERRHGKNGYGNS